MPHPPTGHDRSPGPAPVGARVRRLPPAALAGTVLLGTLLAGAVGCGDRERALRPDDLSRQEAAYVERVLVLERVRAALLVDPDRGVALGDSLAAAWGDSALPESITLAPVDPSRAERVHHLLLRLLAAEHDSLLARDGRRPLDAPWPTPADSVGVAGFPAASRAPAGD
ncbi:hypothetical protein FJ250_07115 [bacterium]|nr:hypothetical protein [bacterium]